MTRMRLVLGGGAGVALAAVVAALLTTGQQHKAAEPAAKPLPVGLQYVPTDAALFGHVEFTPVWKSPLGDTFRKMKIPQLDSGLQELTAISGLTLDDLATATIYLPTLKDPPDLNRLGLILTTHKPYDREKLLAVLANHPLAKMGKFENKNNIVRLQVEAGPAMPIHLYADLRSDTRLVFGIGLKDDPKANPNRAAGIHAATFKQAPDAVLLGGVNFANLPDEIRRDETNFPPQMRPFLPIAKSEMMSLVGKLDGKNLVVSVAARSPNAQTAGEVEKAADILRGLAKIGLDEAEKEIKALEKSGDKSLDGIRPLLNIGTEMAKTLKVEVEDRTTTVTLGIPADVPYRPLVEFATGVRVPTTTMDQNNLKQLGLSLHNYHDANGQMPPTFLVDKKGKPTLSWRVMVLPYIEGDQLYKQFKLDEPWDSAHNLKVLKDNPMPKVFLFPTDKPEDKKTRYRVFSGNGAGWDVTGQLKFANFADGLSNTIAIATAATPVEWTKPDELEFDTEKDLLKLLHFVGDRCNVCIFDGSVRAFKKSMAEATLKAYITRAGGEVTRDE